MPIRSKSVLVDVWALWNCSAIFPKRQTCLIRWSTKNNIRQNEKMKENWCFLFFLCFCFQSFFWYLFILSHIPFICAIFAFHFGRWKCLQNIIYSSTVVFVQQMFVKQIMNLSFRLTIIWLKDFSYLQVSILRTG